MKETFSIVMPVYNRSQTLQRALDSVAAQSWRPIHLIIVDNCSTDNSLTVAERWAAGHGGNGLTVSILTESVRGPGAARQRGLNEVRSRFMLFLDSDDALRPDAVEEYMKVFLASPQTGLVMSDIMVHRRSGKDSAVPRRKGNPLLAHIHHSTLCTLGYAASTDLLRRAGGWNPALHIWEDWELGIRLLLLDPKTGHTGRIASDVYISEESVSGIRYSDKSAYYEDTILAAEESIARSSHPRKEMLMKLMKYRRMMLAALFAREGRPDLAEPLRRRVLRECSGLMLRLMKMAYIYIKSGGRGFDRLLSLALR